MSQESPHQSSQTGLISPSPKPTLSCPPGIAKQINGTEQEPNDVSDNKMFQEIQGSLMVVAVLAAGATYQAGLSPPGGFNIEGKPVLGYKYSRRYTAFFYCNSTAFIMSLVIIILLMNSRFYKIPGLIKVLKFTMILDLFGFMGAYAAGSCRDLPSSIYLFVLMGGVFIYIISFARHYGMVRNCMNRVPGAQQCKNCMKNMVQLNSTNNGNVHGSNFGKELTAKNAI